MTNIEGDTYTVRIAPEGDYNAFSEEIDLKNSLELSMAYDAYQAELASVKD